MSRIEYLMSTNNTIVLDSYVNLNYESNLIDRLYYDSIRFFYNLVVAYFLGSPCRPGLLWCWSHRLAVTQNLRHIVTARYNSPDGINTT